MSAPTTGFMPSPFELLNWRGQRRSRRRGRGLAVRFAAGPTYIALVLVCLWPVVGIISRQRLYGLAWRYLAAFLELWASQRVRSGTAGANANRRSHSVAHVTRRRSSAVRRSESPALFKVGLARLMSSLPLKASRRSPQTQRKARKGQTALAAPLSMSDVRLFMRAARSILSLVVVCRRFAVDLSDR
jgi:hypothetical protein